MVNLLSLQANGIPFDEKGTVGFSSREFAPRSGVTPGHALHYTVYVPLLLPMTITDWNRLLEKFKSFLS